MKTIVRVLKSYYYTLAPFLIASYTVLFLYVQNQHEYKVEVLVFPLVVALIFSLLVLIITKLLCRSLDKAVFLSSVIVFMCLSYGRFLELFDHLKFEIGNLEITPEIAVNTSLALFIVLIAVFIFKAKKSFVKFSQFLTVITALLVLFQLYGIISFEISSGRIARA